MQRHAGYDNKSIQNKERQISLSLSLLCEMISIDSYDPFTFHQDFHLLCLFSKKKQIHHHHQDHCRFTVTKPKGRILVIRASSLIPLVGKACLHSITNKLSLPYFLLSFPLVATNFSDLDLLAEPYITFRESLLSLSDIERLHCFDWKVLSSSSTQ